MVDRWVDFGVSGMMEPRVVVSATDYDALLAAARKVECAQCERMGHDKDEPCEACDGLRRILEGQP